MGENQCTFCADPRRRSLIDLLFGCGGLLFGWPSFSVCLMVPFPYTGDVAQPATSEDAEPPILEALDSMTKLRINVTFPRIAFVPAFGYSRGNEFDKTVHGVLVCSELVLAGSKLRFNTVVCVPKTLAVEERRAKQLALTWLGGNLGRQMAEAGRWNFFQARQLQVRTLEGLEPIEEGKVVEQDIVVSEAIEAEATEAVALLAEVETKFESARERLSDLVSNRTAFGFSMSLSEARRLMQGIELVLQAGDESGCSVASDVRRAQKDYEEVARRKQENNKNYQSALHSLRSFVYGLSFPSTWKSQPRTAWLG